MTLTNAGNLNLVGNITASSFLYSSDRRLKQNITPLSDSLSKILSLNGYSFDWKTTKKSDIGVIAQEVEKVFPALVHTDEKTGLKSVEYGNLVAPIIEAIRELANNVKDNTAEIQALKSENAVLKARLDAIEARLTK
jgi:cell shape-determining protein MreC